MHRTLFGSLLWANSVAALVCVAPAHAQRQDEVQVSLPAQDLSASLRDLSLQSGRNIIAPSELVRGRQAPAISGQFTAEGAVRILLTGSGLDLRRVGETLVIFRPASARDADGEVTGAPAADEGEEIVVTGTNLRGAQPTAPVLVLRREDIEASGSTSVEQLMARVPQNAQGGVNRENFLASGAGADPTEHGAGLNLRGLGQRATLVLVNGRRLAPSGSGSFVDVSLIPLTAVERVEILTDGASAIYGSDAVGGVVNFILRDDFEGLETLVQYGSATKADGDVLQAGATAGTNWTSGGAMLSYEYRAEDEIRARDRDYTLFSPDTALLPRERRHSLFGALRQDLSDSLRAELTGSFAARDTARTYFFAGSAFPVDMVAEANTLSIGGTLRHSLGAGWVARLTGGFSKTRTDEEQFETGVGLVNSRATRNAISDLGLTVDGSLFQLPGGPVRLAVGVEGRHETYDEEFEAPAISLAIDQSRKVVAAFAETQVPIFSALNRRPGLERLILTAAGRWERYDDFGSTFNPKLGLLWSPARGLSLRTSYDTSFRAPLLVETAGAYSAIYLPSALVFIDPAQATGVALALGGSNPEVSPERSRSWTVGAEFVPPSDPGLSVSLNYYSIRFSNRIALPSPIITVVGDPAFESIVTRDPDDEIIRQFIAGAQVSLDISGPNFTNGNATPADVSVIVDGRINNTAVTTTDGLDFNFGYRFSAGRSRFVLNANLNYVFKFTDRLRPSSDPIQALDSPYRPLNIRARTQLGWNRGGWSANLFLNYADSYLDDRGDRSIPISSWTTMDIGLAYEAASPSAPAWLRGTRIALAIDNLFDVDPPRLLPDPGSATGLGYDPVNASGRGRFVSLQLRRRW
ncbi:MAG TPA: TonB-dependent receptor [Allosphingosinicella sp.]|jgi:outer membrane receptor protein involved in Fe transport|uniref:TonB-dependent receptor domain-containing protein n=1 Tax=Allosphingosinicella sp. TaxID=2823234 RepID=UPI002F27927D